MRAIVVAVVIRDGKVLIQQRFRPSIGMVFEFPCGSVEPGENLQEAAARELMEEANLRKCAHVSTVERKNHEGLNIGFVIFSGSVDEEPQITDPARRQTFFWFGPDEIPVEDFPAADKEFIRDDLRGFCL